MRLLIPAILLVFVNHLSFGQGNIKIVLLTDSTIFTNYVDLNNQPTSYATIHSKDGSKVSIRGIHHIEGYDQEGKYRYIGVTTFRGRKIFTERIHDGRRVDLYRTEAFTNGWKTNLLWYSKDDSELIKGRFGKLKKDLKDSPEAMKYLRGGSALRYTQYALYVAGAIVLVKTATKEFGEEKSPPGETSGPPIGFFVSAGLIFAPFLINNLKIKQYEKAGRAYDK
ncbi:MAG: hypothetical protein KDC93_15745 [Cyclobacteriaceae bacterium]|jgi:hypothetical protein|nr:hypothetical protein [Cyclobacteriaceae bacterium]